MTVESAKNIGGVPGGNNIFHCRGCAYGDGAACVPLRGAGARALRR